MLAGFFYLKRAENETRTRDPNLGKVMLYQLSYFRIVSTTVHHFPDCECKGSLFFETTKTIDDFFDDFFNLLIIDRINILIKPIQAFYNLRLYTQCFCTNFFVLLFQDVISYFYC